jgi:hypothetical protein
VALDGSKISFRLRRGYAKKLHDPGITHIKPGRSNKFMIQNSIFKIEENGNA